MADNADNSLNKKKWRLKQQNANCALKILRQTMETPATYEDTSKPDTSQNLKTWKPPIKLKKVIKRQFKLCTKKRTS